MDDPLFYPLSIVSAFKFVVQFIFTHTKYALSLKLFVPELDETLIDQVLNGF